MTDIAPSTTPTIGGTTGIDSGLKRGATRGNLAKAGQQFEAVFTQMMLKSMRAAKLADDDLFGSKALDTFRDMQDGKLAQSMAEHAPLGIGKAMTDFLAKSQANLAPESAAASADPPA